MFSNFDVSSRGSLFGSDDSHGGGLSGPIVPQKTKNLALMNTHGHVSNGNF